MSPSHLSPDLNPDLRPGQQPDDRPPQSGVLRVAEVRQGHLPGWHHSAHLHDIPGHSLTAATKSRSSTQRLDYRAELGTSRCHLVPPRTEVSSGNSNWSWCWALSFAVFAICPKACRRGVAGKLVYRGQVGMLVSDVRSKLSLSTYRGGSW